MWLEREIWKTASLWKQPKFAPVWVFPGRGLFFYTIATWWQFLGRDFFITHPFFGMVSSWSWTVRKLIDYSINLNFWHWSRNLWTIVVKRIELQKNTYPNKWSMVRCPIRTSVWRVFLAGAFSVVCNYTIAPLWAFCDRGLFCYTSPFLNGQQLKLNSAKTN